MKKRRTNKRRSARRRKDSGYMLPIVCISLMTLLSAAMITLFISVILSSEEVPPMTSAADRGSLSTHLSESVNLSGIPDSSTSEVQTTATDAPVTTVGSTAQTVTAALPITTEVPITTAEPATSVPMTETAEPLTTAQPPVTTRAPETDANPMNFKADLSEYEQYMDPTGERWDDAYLMLVNAEHKLAPDQEKSYPVLGGLTAFKNSEDYEYTYYTYSTLRMNENAMKALSAMFIEAEANGLKGLDVTSAYRDYERQSDIFSDNCAKTYHWLCIDEGCLTDWIGKDAKCPLCGKKSTDKSLPITQEEKEANVATYSCAPGTSDHQTGLAVDVVDTTLPSRFNNLIQEYGETESGKWLAENCWKFGFVLRFPPDKEAQTGIIYEPWHFRFVGRTHAEKMHELNMCLEEYTVYLETTGYFD